MEIAVNDETKEANQSVTRLKLRDYIPTIENGLVSSDHRPKRFLDFLRATPSKTWFLKLGSSSSPFSFPRRSRSQSPAQIATISSNPAPSDPAASTNRRSHPFRVSFVRKINWESLLTYCKKWIKHPMNVCLVIWFFFVAACLVALFLLMTGLLNHTIRKSSVRKNWTEILNQILNALFTIMCLYQHPRISHHLVLLCRYRPEDVVELRITYCKNKTRKPNERAHMLIVVILLQITCFSQYGLCSLYWAFTSNTRPDWAQILFIALGTAAPIIAGVYAIFSPLGRKSESENDEEQPNNEEISEEDALKVCNKVLVASPEWIGGTFDCRDDVTVCCLSLFCTFCVFGWNMERLGFGNMYVHIMTFMLLCIAPVLVFSISALNINNGAIRYTVGITGIVLCLFGFLYGGFWRIRIRRKFKLPSNGFCCGFSNLSDFVQWLFCWPCSLAQEVRTGNFYDVESDGFYLKVGEDGGERDPNPSSGEALGLESEAARLSAAKEEGSGDGSEGGVDGAVRIVAMVPPVQSLMKEEDEVQGRC